MGYEVRDRPTQDFVVTNWNEDLSLDCDVLQYSGAAVATADVLGTLIRELQFKGVVRGTTSA